MLTYIRCGVRLMAGPASLVHAKGRREQREKWGRLGARRMFLKFFSGQPNRCKCFFDTRLQHTNKHAQGKKRLLGRWVEIVLLKKSGEKC
jgi:hypothetical protein